MSADHRSIFDDLVRLLERKVCYDWSDVVLHERRDEFVKRAGRFQLYVVLVRLPCRYLLQDFGRYDGYYEASWAVES